MDWIGPEEDQPVIDEIERQTDRAAALIAQAYMEQRLLNAIKLGLKTKMTSRRGCSARQDLSDHFHPG
jgi:hypothetical protein